MGKTDSEKENPARQSDSDKYGQQESDTPTGRKSYLRYMEQKKSDVELQRISLSNSSLASVGAIAEMIAEQAAYAYGVFSVKLTKGELDGKPVGDYTYNKNEIHLNESQKDYVQKVANMVREDEQLDYEMLQIAVKIQDRNVDQVFITGTEFDLR